VLGAVVGDLVGSTFEFLGMKVKDFEPFIRPNARFTDIPEPWVDEGPIEWDYEPKTANGRERYR